MALKHPAKGSKNIAATAWVSNNWKFSKKLVKTFLTLHGAIKLGDSHLIRDRKLKKLLCRIRFQSYPT